MKNLVLLVFILNIAPSNKARSQFPICVEPMTSKHPNCDRTVLSFIEADETPIFQYIDSTLADQQLDIKGQIH